MAKKTREAKPGELREINLLESMERLSKKAESRIDLQKFFDNLTPNTKTYAKHLVTSGPSSIAAAAKACTLTQKDIEAALEELEKGILTLRNG